MTAEAEIRDLLEQRAEAARAKDVDGAIAAFAADVLTFDVVNPMQHVGADDVRPRTEQWFSSFRGPIGYEMRDVSVTAGDHVAFATFSIE